MDACIIHNYRVIIRLAFIHLHQKHHKQVLIVGTLIRYYTLYSFFWICDHHIHREIIQVQAEVSAFTFGSPSIVLVWSHRVFELINKVELMLPIFELAVEVYVLNNSVFIHLSWNWYILQVHLFVSVIQPVS